MVVKHKKMSLLGRILRRCPKCSTIFALKIESKNKNSITGIQRKYVCSKCKIHVDDWEASDSIKF